jgi:DNA-directed RNA polymerase specialized sigma subunit
MQSKYSFLKIAFALNKNLSQEEELELLKKYQSGDVQAYTKLRVSLRNLMEQAIRNAIPSGSPELAPILRSIAETKLPEILKIYDPNRGVKLNTFILNQLSGHMRNAVAENMSGPYVPRNLHTDLARLKRAERDARMEFGTNPTDDQIRQFYPEDIAKTPYDKIKQHHMNSYLADAKFSNDDDDEALTFKDQFNTGYGIEEDDIFSSMFEEENEQKVSTHFTKDEQKVIDKVMKEGQRFVEVALSLGISTSEVSKIMRRYHSVTQAQ